MKAARGSIPGVLDKPDPRIRFYLLSGADESGSRALAARLLKALGAEKVPLSGAQMKADPALLADEAAAISMFGDKRLLWIEPAGEEIVSAVEALLEAPAVEAPAIAIAGTLKKGSALAKLAEAHPFALAHVSYVPEGRDAARFILEIGRELGLRIGPAIADRIVAEAAGDQQIARRELEKFALYLSADPDAPRELEDDVLDLLGADSSESDTNSAGDLALSGDLARLADALQLLESSGVEPIPVVRALQRRLLMLAPLRAKIEGGQSVGAVTASVWRRDQAAVGRILPRWTAPRLAEVFQRVQELEQQLLLSPVGGHAALGEALTQIARAARR